MRDTDKDKRDDGEERQRTEAEKFRNGEKWRAGEIAMGRDTERRKER